MWSIYVSVNKLPLVQIMACLLVGPEPSFYLNQCGNIVHWTLRIKVSEFKHFHWRKYVWKCRLRSPVHFVSASMCWYCIANDYSRGAERTDVGGGSGKNSWVQHVPSLINVWRTISVHCLNLHCSKNCTHGSHHVVDHCGVMQVSCTQECHGFCGPWYDGQ